MKGNFKELKNLRQERGGFQEVKTYKKKPDLGVPNKCMLLFSGTYQHPLVDLEDKIFRNINMKGFSVDEKDQAVEFLKNS